MNKEILKRNIEQVINQPCIDNPWNKNSDKIAPNGISKDGTYIMVKTRCDDTSQEIHLVDRDGNKLDYVDTILRSLPEKFRDHLVTLRHEAWISCSYLPVFDTDTQADWDDRVNSYMKAKQEWCDQYGCD